MLWKESGSKTCDCCGVCGEGPLVAFLFRLVLLSLL